MIVQSMRCISHQVAKHVYRIMSAKREIINNNDCVNMYSVIVATMAPKIEYYNWRER